MLHLGTRAMPTVCSGGHAHPLLLCFKFSVFKRKAGFREARPKTADLTGELDGNLAPSQRELSAELTEGVYFALAVTFFRGVNSPRRCAAPPSERGAP